MHSPCRHTSRRRPTSRSAPSIRRAEQVEQRKAAIPVRCPICWNSNATPLAKPRPNSGASYHAVLHPAADVPIKSISLRDANQGFARCIREVEAGEEFVITRNGAPVARLVPVQQPDVRKLTQAGGGAGSDEAGMAEGWPLGGERIGHDEFFDRAIRRED
jgi:prevent-host-death family protein